jgi:hypothetical protein
MRVRLGKRHVVTGDHPVTTFNPQHLEIASEVSHHIATARLGLGAQRTRLPFTIAACVTRSGQLAPG